MAYRVIKWVKGRPYLYEQRSFRVGGQVRTESKYLGAASSADVQVYSRTKKTRDRVASTLSESPEAATSAGVTEAGTRTDTSVETRFEAPANRSGVTPAMSTRTITPTRKKKTRVITTKIAPGATLPTFESKVDLKGKKIGQRALEVEQENFLKRLEKTGLDVSTFPQITLKYGGRVTHKRTLTGSYVVTLRKHGRGQRTQFKDVFSKALVRAGLEMVKKQQPETYLQLAEEFDSSFRKTQDLIRTFMLKSNDRKAWFKWLNIRYWGNIAQLKKNLVGDARRIGVIDFSKRRTGLDELVNILAHTNRQGLGRTITEQKKYHAQAKRELESAEAEYVHSKWYDPRRQAARKRWQRAEARVAAQREMRKKISLVRSLFY